MTHRTKLAIHNISETMGLPLMMVFGEIIAAMAATALGQARPGCQGRCGDVNVPYPFGIGDGCYNHKSLNLSCYNRSPTPILRIFNSRFRVTNISLEGQVSILSRIGYACYDKSGSTLSDSYKPTFQLPKNAYTISSTLNKFTVVGCDSSGTVQWGDYATGCSTKCDNPTYVSNGNCSGFGCCQTSIPREVKYYTRLNASSFNNHRKVWNFSRCTFAFVVEADKFNFSRDYLNKTKREFFRLQLPTAIDWTIGLEKCDGAKNKSDFACRGKSECYTPESMKYGYRCRCLEGYEGNPYITNGCKDIDECKDKKLNQCSKLATCVNKEGNYTCSCRNGYHGDGRKDGENCTSDPSHDRLIKIVASVAISVAALLVCSSWLYLRHKNRELIKLRRKFFEQNGGQILDDELRKREGSNEKIKIYKSEQLEEVTKKYDREFEIGRGGFGTVYKGTLDGREVAIKKPKMVDQSLVNQFILEILILSEIDHKNVVKLLGCCLETKVPLLVYEYITNGNLFQQIKSKRSPFFWKTRLSIAVETAEALKYLHFDAPDSIIHRDVKSANILLDHNFSAKVIDFGQSRIFASHRDQLSIMVQGTQGYLDPEYLHTNKLTKKSDVYSFGVVLVELLTGEVASSFEIQGREDTLVSYFLSSPEENRLPDVFDQSIRKEENEEQLMKTADLARRCLSVKGTDRPSMIDVLKDLQDIQNIPPKKKNDMGASVPSPHELNPGKVVGRGIKNDVLASMPSPQELNLEETEYVFGDETQIP
ncbi:hypothetical protein F0562_028085 [Nyssa sinensis]|uniref:Protein kinase domain-containing protein n=1 Tax=Nyssa sinensis TaxID=561372 RepID=A0A5J5B6K4_9ASTE|nr:hypothetical protein F0562_028085 [Nyssa sinensis]